MSHDFVFFERKLYVIESPVIKIKNREGEIITLNDDFLKEIKSDVIPLEISTRTLEDIFRLAKMDFSKILTINDLRLVRTIIKDNSTFSDYSRIDHSYYEPCKFSDKDRLTIHALIKHFSSDSCHKVDTKKLPSIKQTALAFGFSEENITSIKYFLGCIEINFDSKIPSEPLDKIKKELKEFGIESSIRYNFAFLNTPAFKTIKISESLLGNLLQFIELKHQKIAQLNNFIYIPG